MVSSANVVRALRIVTQMNILHRPGPLCRLRVLAQRTTMTHSLARLSLGRLAPALMGASLAAGLVMGAASAVAKPPATPQVLVTDAWIRASVPGQAGTGGFMKLTAQQQALTLQGFSSTAASTAELHEMAMEGDVMRMRPVDALPLPKGQTVELKPGSYHLMLMGLKGTLKAGATVPVRLLFKDAKGKSLEQRLTVPVLSAAPGGVPATAVPSGHEHHHDH